MWKRSKLLRFISLILVCWKIKKTVDLASVMIPEPLLMRPGSLGPFRPTGQDEGLCLLARYDERLTACFVGSTALVQRRNGKLNKYC